MKVLHTALWVSDLDASKEFYIDELGLEHTRDFVGDDGVTNFYVAGDGGAELQFKYDSDGVETVDPSGVDHISIGVEDADETVDRLVDRTGCRVVVEPQTIDIGEGPIRVAFVEDPDGYVLELEQSGE
ncbi:MAG: VOC family protein [Halobacteriota archaeon]